MGVAQQQIHTGHKYCTSDKLRTPSHSIKLTVLFERAANRCPAGDEIPSQLFL
jgi:hypothetical protein